jgi:hypothetical protein
MYDFIVHYSSIGRSCPNAPTYPLPEPLARTPMASLFTRFFKMITGNRKESSLQSSYQDFTHLYHTDGHFSPEFYSNLVQTIRWTETLLAGIDSRKKIDYTRVLRTNNPLYNGQSFYKFDGTLYNFAATPQLPFNYKNVLDAVLEERV